MISIRHRLLSVCENRAWSSPVQIEDNIHSMIENPLNKVINSINIVLSTILRLNPVYTQPALFVQWNPHSVSIPILHVLDHIVIIWTIEYSVTIYTLELCP